MPVAPILPENQVEMYRVSYSPMRLRSFIASVLFFVPLPAWCQPPEGLSANDRKQIETDLKELTAQLAGLRNVQPKTPLNSDWSADAEIFRKGVIWALAYEMKLEPADVALLKKALHRCQERIDALKQGKPLWPDKKGKLVRGFVSEVDGSTQPYGLIVPSNYTPTRPIRLDVVLHGSSPAGRSERTALHESLR